jgi:hypothetical protein
MLMMLVSVKTLKSMKERDRNRLATGNFARLDSRSFVSFHMFRHQHKLRETQLSLRPLNDAFSEEIPRGSISYETGHANDVGSPETAGTQIERSVSNNRAGRAFYRR